MFKKFIAVILTILILMSLSLNIFAETIDFSVTY